MGCGDAQVAPKRLPDDRGCWVTKSEFRRRNGGGNRKWEKALAKWRSQYRGLGTADLMVLIAERDAQLAERDAQLAERDVQLATSQVCASLEGQRARAARADALLSVEIAEGAMHASLAVHNGMLEEMGRIGAAEAAARMELMRDWQNVALAQQRDTLTKKYLASMHRFRDTGREIILSSTASLERKCHDLLRRLQVTEMGREASVRAGVVREAERERGRIAEQRALLGLKTTSELRALAALSAAESTARSAVAQQHTDWLEITAPAAGWAKEVCATAQDGRGGVGNQGRAPHPGISAEHAAAALERAAAMRLRGWAWGRWRARAPAAADAAASTVAYGDCAEASAEERDDCSEEEEGKLDQAAERRGTVLLLGAQGTSAGPTNGAFGDITFAQVPVVIKRIQTGGDAQMRKLLVASLTREATMLEVLNAEGDSAVQLLGTFELGSPSCALVLERLQRTLAQAAPLRGRGLRKAVLGLLRAFDALYSRNIVMLDVKPDNTMLTAAGEPKLIDFGIDRFDGEYAECGYIWPWRPLEWLLGFGQSATCNSDWHGLGLLLCYAATGRHPTVSDGLDDAQSQTSLLGGLERFLGLGCEVAAKAVYTEGTFKYDYAQQLFSVDAFGVWSLRCAGQSPCEYVVGQMDSHMPGLSDVVRDLCLWEPDMRAAPGEC